MRRGGEYNVVRSLRKCFRMNTAVITAFLVFSEYGENIEKFIQYIPNMSDICRACKGSYPAQSVLVSLNTRESYPLDLFEQGIDPEDYQSNEVLIFGYDEISRTSIHRMKNIFIP